MHDRAVDTAARMFVTTKGDGPMASKKKHTKKATAQKVRVLDLGHMSEPIRRAGGDVECIAPSDPKAIEAAQHADAIILAGGGDVDPTWYADEVHPRVYGLNEQRDVVEMAVLDVAAERGIPVLGICRGSQIMNVWGGGTLHQHIADIPTTHRFHQGHQHRVVAMKGSRLRAAMGVNEAWVTSIHHQAVAVVADGFIATSWAHDGTVETVEAVDRWWVGVQFHPEMAYEQNPMQGIFDALVREAAKVAGLPTPRRVRVKKATAKTTKTTNVRRDWDARLRATKPTTKIDRQASLWERERSRRSMLDDGHMPEAGPVVSRWVCFRCGIDFDVRADHIDHMLYMHEIDVLDWTEAQR